ncbi:uncharacterized protein LACBIDRAFT_325216 [Laccaria bicolor S238N-H82]|uniref:Predicted protein n=1 Tax=Laccaria bicolor (strain S238N-H82 / ATCC MYA-4686) TaxID=486041 RepID=B0D479_LACBS|nr:uncharacterized protein LACBIDRAFT_325216 [Laccaria bicolor S238N-H82]EDR10529.1 predicted protein [Laccaria bicolor S238N-H82]|eukprot:XP_001878979.1 predicted protein [Laccaria bicolor S238N-H82]
MANTLKSDLESEKDSKALKTSLPDGQKATLANDLPPELLVHIFEMAQNMFFLNQCSTWHFPFILGKVYLGRSKDSPIDLNITFTLTLSQRGISTLIGILQPHYRCCCSIRVKSELFYKLTREIPSILEWMCQGHYPMLQHICVEGLDPHCTRFFTLTSPKCYIPVDLWSHYGAGVSELLLSISAPDLEELTIAPIVHNDFSKFRRKTSNAPRFPALKSLTLAPANDGKLTTLAQANACFPGIKLLILPNYNELYIVESFKTKDSRPFWPELDGLAVHDIDDQGVLCALALTVPGSLVNVKNDPNGLAKGSIVGGGGRSMEDTM